MSLTRQVGLLLFGVLLFALLGSMATHTLLARQSLSAQLQARNDEAAAMLALALSQQHGDAERMQRIAALQFDTGRYRRLRLLRADGSPIFDRDMPERLGTVPRWFAQRLAPAALPGQAELSDGGRSVGRLQLWSQAEWAPQALWHSSLHMAGWLAMLGAAAAAVAALAVRAWRRPLDATMAQAQALEEQRFVIADEPRVPELGRLVRSMNSLVRRLQRVFEQQAASLDELRQRAHADAVTGLPLRAHFLARLQQSLQAEKFRGAGLLLVRLRQLQAMNLRIGHDATDRLLAALAQGLQSYPRHVPGALTGRLNGSDFALLLPATGMAEETARTLQQALRAAMANVDPEAELVIGAAELPLACSATAALSRADAALAQAEAGGAFAVALAPDDGLAHGEGGWRDRLTAALCFGRARLAHDEVHDRNGELLHLDCPMHLQLDADGPFEPGARWLAMALRCRLSAQADLVALDLALQAICRDGRARCIHLAAASLARDGFASEVQQRLEAAPHAAARLWIDLAEGAALQPRRLGEVASGWRRLGVRVGLEHAGLRLRELAQLPALGVDYVRIDAAFVQGVASRPGPRELAHGLVTLLHGMQLQVLAGKVADADDLAVLWQLGFDGATAAALRAPVG